MYRHRRTFFLAAIALCVVLVVFGVYSVFSDMYIPSMDTQRAQEYPLLVGFAVNGGASTSAAVYATSTPTVPVVSIDGQSVRVMLALTPAQQEQGLGGRAGLGDHEGMLFMFPSDDEHLFWMKDMRFSIDMIWFSSDGTVIYIQSNVAPETYPEAFGPEAPSRYVLEVPANFAARYGIRVGDYAILPRY